MAGNLKTKIPNNEFLCTKKTYKNFILKLEVKLVGGIHHNAFTFRHDRHRFLRIICLGVGVSGFLAATFWAASGGDSVNVGVCFSSRKRFNLRGRAPPLFDSRWVNALFREHCRGSRRCGLRARGCELRARGCCEVFQNRRGCACSITSKSFDSEIN